MKKAAPPTCDHTVTIGSYPGEGFAMCHLPAGHEGDHQAIYAWEQKWPECDNCPAPA